MSLLCIPQAVCDFVSTPVSHGRQWNPLALCHECVELTPVSVKGDAALNVRD
jgi:hypothetical protein